MPSNRKVKSGVDPTSEDFQEYLDAGNYWAIQVALTGNPDNSISLADIADHVIVERNGSQLMNVPYEFLHKVVDEWYGTLIHDMGGTAGDRSELYIPFFYPEKFNNALNIQSDQELEVTIQFNQSTLSTAVGTGTLSCEVRRILSSGIGEGYVPRIKKRSTSMNAGDAGRREEFGDSGIVRLFVDDKSNVVTNAQVEIDDRILFSNGSLDSANSLANLLNRVEGSPDDLVEINPFQGPPPVGASERFAAVEYDSPNSGGTVDTYRLMEKPALR